MRCTPYLRVSYEVLVLPTLPYVKMGYSRGRSWGQAPVDESR